MGRSVPAPITAILKFSAIVNVEFEWVKRNLTRRLLGYYAGRELTCEGNVAYALFYTSNFYVCSLYSKASPAYGPSYNGLPEYPEAPRSWGLTLDKGIYAYNERTKVAFGR